MAMLHACNEADCADIAWLQSCRQTHRRHVKRRWSFLLLFARRQPARLTFKCSDHCRTASNVRETYIIISLHHFTIELPRLLTAWVPHASTATELYNMDTIKARCRCLRNGCCGACSLPLSCAARTQTCEGTEQMSSHFGPPHLLQHSNGEQHACTCS